ncbi:MULTISPECIES: hypothetical protein [Roseateles]|uniref:Response regulatory domain-containing protein n=1 Tax=Pelomonas caseinilytica TaxID=2906763 RepID=A0ABS8XP96_9BURK|nr:MULTISPECIES: hypothetical protein [unclassified Roseateles]MCE4540396.1 hypothetical protein [Pelomonas sp. P7]HEV6965547.1 hypothetical protein [Roseateles sp.]
MKTPLPRVLVVSDSADLRWHFSTLLYELIVDVYWQLELKGLVEFAHWCEPHLVILAMRDLNDSYAAYQGLAGLLKDSAARVALVGAPQDGAPYPSRDRFQLDGYLSAPPTLHELAWLVQQCRMPAAKLPPKAGKPFSAPRV